jgi:hypothetical protein
MQIEYFNTSIGSVGALAKTLGVQESALIQFAKNPPAHYSITAIPKKNGGSRTISDPSKELKIIQRRIVRRIFSKCVFPDYLFGSIKDDENPRDFVRNAEHHVHAVEVMSFDIESFFPNVRPSFIKNVFKYLLRLPNEVADILVKLTSLNNGLPQGAPTSSYIANMIFYDKEHQVVKTLSAKGFCYTRLTDDITVSSPKALTPEVKKFVYAQIQGLLSEKKLEICKRKYKITNTALSGRKTVVTGLVIEDDLVKLPKPMVSKIGGIVYDLKNKAVITTTDPEYHELYGTASGLVSLYTRLNAKKAEPHRIILQSIKPTFDLKRVAKISWLCRKFIEYAKHHPAAVHEEWFAKKYHKFKHKVSIIRRTNRTLALNLEKELSPHKPTRLLASYHE